MLRIVDVLSFGIYGEPQLGDLHRFFHPLFAAQQARQSPVGFNLQRVTGNDLAISPDGSGIILMRHRVPGVDGQSVLLREAV